MEVSIDISEHIPEKTDAYVSYSSAKREFYVSTTDKSDYDGFVSIDDIVDLFIDGYIEQDDKISKESSRPFIEDLEKAIKRVKDLTRDE